MSANFAEFGTPLDLSREGRRLEGDAPDFSRAGSRLDLSSGGTAVDDEVPFLPRSRSTELPGGRATLGEQLFAGFDEYRANRQTSRALDTVETGSTLEQMRRGTGNDVVLQGQIKLERARGNEPEAQRLEARLAEVQAQTQDPQRQARFTAARDRLTATLNDAIERRKELSARAASVPLSKDTQEMVQAEGLREAFGELADDPIRIVAELGARSLPNMIEMIPAAIGGGLIGGPLGAMAGAGASSGMVEYRASFAETLKAAGVNLDNAESLIEAASNPELMAEAHKRAMVRAGIIGAADAATMGVAGRTLAPTVLRPLAREATNLVAQTGVQAAGGAGGEAAAQLATEGKIRAGDVLAEAAGEMVTAPVDVGTAAVSGIRAERAQRQQAPQAGQPAARRAEVVQQTAAETVTFAAERRAVLEAKPNLSPAEQQEVDFLRRSANDPAAIANAYGVNLAEPLADGDIQSPIPTDVIQKGREIVEQALNGEVPDARASDRAGAPAAVPGVPPSGIAPSGSAGSVEQQPVPERVDVAEDFLDAQGAAGSQAPAGETGGFVQGRPNEVEPPPQQVGPDEYDADTVAAAAASIPGASAADFSSAGTRVAEDFLDAEARAPTGRKPFDDRLTSDEHRGGLEGMLRDLQPGGGVAYVKDEHDRITGRTPSQNPPWFQNLGSSSDTKLSVDAIGRAVDKALNGKILGEREKRVITAMLDYVDEQNSYRPIDDDLTPEGLTADDAADVSLVARASEIDEGAVERAAQQYGDDDAGFRSAIQAIVDRANESSGEAAPSREPSPAAQAPKPGADLFGQDTRAAQSLADETRRRDEQRSPNKDVSLETGDPSDLFSKARGQGDLVDAARAPRKAADDFLAEVADGAVRDERPGSVEAGAPQGAGVADTGQTPGQLADSVAGAAAPAGARRGSAGGVSAADQAADGERSLAGEPIDGEWVKFSDDSGTLGIPRDQMPQIKAEHRGALTQFLLGRGIKHVSAFDMDPAALKATQAEYSTKKVDKAKNYEGGDRAILISFDNHVLDGHHQWIAAREQSKPIKVIRFKARIKKLLAEAAQFPSAETADGATESAPVETPVATGEKLPPGYQTKYDRAPTRPGAPLDQSDIDAAVGDALHSFTEADSRWKTAREKGLTDEQLMEAIGRELGISGSRGLGPMADGIVWVNYTGGKNPRIEVTRYPDKKPVKLTGKKLLDTARRVLDIKAPALPPLLKPLTPSKNTVFTDDAAEKARALLKSKLGQITAGVDPEILQAGITLAGYHIEKGARTFAAYSKAMVDDLGDAIRPYLKSFYMAIKYDPRASDFAAELDSAAAVESADVAGITDNLERDSADAEPAPPIDEAVDGARAERPAGGARQAGGGTGIRGGLAESDARVLHGGALAVGERSDQSVRADDGQRLLEGEPAGSDDAGRGDLFGDGAVQPDREGAAESREALERAERQRSKVAKQKLANQVPVIPGDRANIDKSLPYLIDGQREDVQKAEVRFAKPDGYGMLFTNGTGTGKTFTGLGVIRRFVSQGKRNILIAVPSDKIMSDWMQSGVALGLSINALADTKSSASPSAGGGVVITTFANLGQNRALADRKWDLVVADEAHYLLQGKDGEITEALRSLRALTLHPEGDFRRAEMLHRDLLAELDRLNERNRAIVEANRRNGGPPLSTAQENEAERAQRIWAAARKEVAADVAKRQGAERPRALFLSATPFAYEKAVEWAQGYLFDYAEGQPTDETGRGYNGGDNRDRFFMQHFGYRMRYNKLTEPEADVDRGVMQRQFNGMLKKAGSLSGRVLDVEADYDRRFVNIESKIGNRIDAALEWLGTFEGISADDRKGRQLLERAIRGKFDHLSRRYLLEAIKAEASIDYVKSHMAMGRKVVVFHDFKKGGGFNPFDIQLDEAESVEGEVLNQADTNALTAAHGEYRRIFKDLIESDIGSMRSPIQAYQAEFPNLLLFNGDVPPKLRRQNADTFNSDDTGPRVILVQSAAGKEGISLHDTSGKHQRVELNLGLPTQPTTAIQEEGRIYRLGSVTDALFRYFNTGTNWEKWAFATTIANRASAAENLAQGEQARALKDAFIAAFQEADEYPAGMENEGKGGKERDRATNNATSEFDRAVAFYYGTQKKTARTKAREGADYFATPEPLGLKMMEWAGVRPGERVLEPSAGHGAIARWAPSTADATAIEPSSELASRLAMVFDGAVKQQRFEDLHITNKYDAIVMNPPFGHGGSTSIEHLNKAVGHLRAGGRVVALIPTGPAADAKFEKWYEGIKGVYLVADVKLPQVTFERAATKVATRVVVLDKVADADLSDYVQLAQPVTRELNDIDSIKELFARLENMDLPKRPEPVAPPEAEKPAAAASTAPAGTYAAAQTKHSKTGADLFVAKVMTRMPREQYDAEVRRAKAAGGWYSSFKGGGAIPGFQFKTQAARDGFMAAAAPAEDSALDLGFFSALRQAAYELKQEKGTPEQMLAMIVKTPGVKPDEIEWTGFGDWIKTRTGTVTKGEIQEFLDQNGVQVEEVTLGDKTSALETKARELQVKLDALGYDVDTDIDGDLDRVLLRNPPNPVEFFYDGEDWVNADDTEQPLAPEVAKLATEYGKALADFNAERNEVGNLEGTSFESYTLPGGENYREVLLTLPPSEKGKPEPITELPPDYETITDKVAGWGVKPVKQPHGLAMGGWHKTEAEAVANAIALLNNNALSSWDYGRRQGAFRSSHFSESNIVAHVRLKDRTTADGKRVLFVEEIQSDWAQKGRKKGFQGQGELPPGYKFEERKHNGETVFVILSPENSVSAYATTREQALLEFNKSGIGRIDARPPRAPFVEKTDAWAGLAIKRVLRLAVDGGYDAIAWTTGEQQAERYDLSKEVDAITWRQAPRTDNAPGVTRYVSIETKRTADAFMLRVKDDGKIVSPSNEQFHDKHLSDVIGKAIADRILASTAGGEIAGDGLKIGGEGMIGFYDGIVPKLFKKLGGRIQAVPLDTTNRLNLKWRYEGPERTANEVMALMDADLGVTVEKQLINISLALKAGRPFKAAIENHGSIIVAEQLGGKLITDEPAPVDQPGIVITPEMREKIGAGQPLFDREASGPAARAKFDAALSDLKDRLEQVGIADRVALRLTADIKIRGEAVAGARGKYDRALRVIEIAMSTADKRHTLDHEIIHALKDLGVIRDAEWRTLVDKATGDEPLMTMIRARYGKRNLSDEQMTEEAIAEMHANWTSGKFAPQGFIRTAFERIKQFFEALANALKGQGFQSADDVFRAIGRGAMGNRIRGGRNLETIDMAEYLQIGDQPTFDPKRAAAVQRGEPLKFDNEKSEARWQDARKGMAGQETWLDRASARAEQIKNGFTRHFIHLPNEAKFSEAREQLRKIEAAPQASKEEVIRTLRAITDGMSAADLDLFTRKAVLDDLAFEVDEQHELPFGFAPADVRDELARLVDVLKGRPDLRDKLELRRALSKKIANDLVRWGVLHKEQIKNPAYYRHQVLDYARAQVAYAKGAGKKLKTPHWARRMGSRLDINANLLEAEFEWMQKALTDIAVARTIDWFKQSDYNVRDEVVSNAKAHNERLVNKLLADDLAKRPYVRKSGKPSSPLNDEWMGFKQRIAYGLKLVREALESGQVDVPSEFASVAAALEAETQSEGNLFAFLAWMLDNNVPGSMGAAMAFKATNQRKAWARAQLGERYADPMNLDELVKRGFAPDGYKTWQPDEGNLLFTAKTIPEHVMDRLIKRVADEHAGPISADEMRGALESVRSMLTSGGPKYQMVLPGELADTLSNLKDIEAEGLFDAIAEAPMRAWKRWVLINPRRVLKYNLNNLSGDLDAIIAGSPKALKKLPQAIRELRAVMLNGKSPSARYKEAVERGVFDSGLTVQEIPDIKFLSEFEHLTDRGIGTKLLSPVKKTWGALQRYTQFRENWMRYAAYLDYVERLEAGEDMRSIGYGAANRSMVDAVTDHKDRAALLARELVGDYGAISHYGKGIRRKIIPFWSWTEINTKRYWRLASNAWDQGIGQGFRTSGVIGATLGVRATAYLTLRAFAIYAAIQLWNNLVHGDEEDELSAEERARMHLILGRTPSGEVVTIRLQGALSDALAWFGFNDAVGMLSEVEKGRASWGDVATAMAKAPVNKLASGITPVITAPVEAATGKKIWPDVFEPRQVRDRWRNAAQLFSLEHEYDAIFDRPSRGYARSLVESAAYARDPGESAYNRMKGMAYDWEERETGQGGGGGYQTPRSKALYEWRQAQKFGDREAETKALSRLRELGVRNDALRASIRAAHPLGNIALRDRARFIRTLSPEERQALSQAVDWYNETFLE